MKEQEEEIAETKAATGDTASVATDAAAQAAVQAPLALLGALFASPAGPAALAGGAKMLARNIPLVVLLVLIGMLFWPTGERAAASDADDTTRTASRTAPMRRSPMDCIATRPEPQAGATERWQ